MVEFSISVVIPTFNRKWSLSRAIDSVLGQSLRPQELIVVDDGSTDQTAEWIKKTYAEHSSFLKVCRLDQNLGVSAARNRGASRASGQWVAFLDSDDEWLPNKLERQFEVLRKSDPALPLIHCNERWMRNGQLLNQKQKHKKMGGDFFVPSLELCLISPSAVLIERDFFLAIGGFREDFIVCEDYDLWLRILAQHKVGFCEEILLIKHGGHNDQLSQKLNAMDLYRIRSLERLVTSAELTVEKKKAALRVGLVKCQILLNGFAKHNNFADTVEVENIKQIFEREKACLAEF